MRVEEAEAIVKGEWTSVVKLEKAKRMLALREVADWRSRTSAGPVCGDDDG